MDPDHLTGLGWDANECVYVLVSQSCLTLCDPVDCSLPGSSVHRILQARILEWVAISFSREHSWRRDWTQVSCIGRQILYHLRVPQLRDLEITPLKYEDHLFTPNSVPKLSSFLPHSYYYGGAKVATPNCVFLAGLIWLFLRPERLKNHLWPSS